MNKAITTFALAFSFGGALMNVSQAKDTGNIIVPGQSAGATRLGESGAQLAKALGPASGGDAAMGHFWSTWTGKKYTLDVYSVRNAEGNETNVKQIHVTSPWFHTPDGITTRSSFAQVKAKYNLQFVKSYNSKRLDGPIFMYDDVKKGIAFEIWKGKEGMKTAGRCVGMIVHYAGKKVTSEYAPPDAYLSE